MMERFNNNNNNISIIRIAFLMHALFHCGTCAQSLDSTTTTIVHADADADADNYDPSYPSVSDLDSIDVDATNYNVSKVILSYLILSTWIIAVMFFFIALRNEIHTFFAKVSYEYFELVLTSSFLIIPSKYKAQGKGSSTSFEMSIMNYENQADFPPMSTSDHYLPLPSSTLTLSLSLSQHLF